MTNFVAAGTWTVPIFFADGEISAKPHFGREIYMISILYFCGSSFLLDGFLLSFMTIDDK
jgi:hypothetical protein